MNNIKVMLSIGLSLTTLTIFSIAKAANDSTDILPPVTTPGEMIVRDKGVTGQLLAYSFGGAPRTATFTALHPSTVPKCPPSTTPKVVTGLAGSVYPDSAASTFRYYGINCGEPDPTTYVVTCKDALAFWAEGITAAIYISWTLYCVPNNW